MVDDRHIENRFSAITQQPVIWNVCVGKQFFSEFRKWDTYQRFIERASYILNILS